MRETPNRDSFHAVPITKKFSKSDRELYATLLQTEAVARRWSMREVFLEILQNSQQKDLCQSLFFK